MRNEKIMEQYNGMKIKVIDFPFGDCTNNGLSSKKKDLIIGIDVYVMQRFLFGKYHYYIRPCKDHDDNKTDYMNGGNTAIVEGLGKLKIHDRQETWEEYETYSN